MSAGKHTAERTHKAWGSFRNILKKAISVTKYELFGKFSNTNNKKN